MQSFINKNAYYFRGARLIVDRALEVIKVNVQWASTYHDTIVKNLETYSC